MEKFIFITDEVCPAKRTLSKALEDYRLQGRNQESRASLLSNIYLQTLAMQKCELPREIAVEVDGLQNLVAPFINSPQSQTEPELSAQAIVAYAAAENLLARMDGQEARLMGCEKD